MPSLRLGRVEFSPTLIPTLVALFAVGLTLWLGRWQLNRASEKLVLLRQYEAVRAEPEVVLTGKEGDNAARLQFHKLAAVGEFDVTKEIFLDNQVENQRVGFYVLTPLRLPDNRHFVLVNRGWVPRDRDYPAPPKVVFQTGELKVQGYGALPVKRFLELSSDTVQGRVWQNVTFARYERISGLSLLPIVLLQTSENAEGLTPVEQQADFGISKHYGYAFQWFALSVGIVVTYLFVNTRYMKK